MIFSLRSACVKSYRSATEPLPSAHLGTQSHLYESIPKKPPLFNKTNIKNLASDGVFTQKKRARISADAPICISGNYLITSLTLAALPVLSRRYVSLARRTLPRRITVMLSRIGECSGQVFSTPQPFEFLRTVNVS